MLLRVYRRSVFRLESEKPNHVLIITIYNAQYPVTVVRIFDYDVR